MGHWRAASAKPSRTSRPVNPVPSSVTPGSSVRLANATTQRRSSAAGADATSRITSGVSVHRQRAPRRRPSTGAGVAEITVMTAGTCLADALDADEVTREPDGLRHGHAEEERRPLAGRGLRRHQVGSNVFDDVDPVVRDQDVVDDERLLRIFAGNHFHAPRVVADGDDLLAHEPVGGILADAGLATVVGGVLSGELLEEVAPPRVDDEDVAFAESRVVHLEARLDVGRGDQRTLVEARILARRVALE